MAAKKKVATKKSGKLKTVSKAKKITGNREDRRGKNPRSLANLKPFEKGHSGNISGRPKLLGEAYKVKLGRVKPDDKEGRTYAEVMADALFEKGMEGDVTALREVRAATEGDRLVVDTWETRVIQAIKSGEVDYESIVEEFGKTLAADLFGKAGKEPPLQPFTIEENRT